MSFSYDLCTARQCNVCIFQKTVKFEAREKYDELTPTASMPPPLLCQDKLFICDGCKLVVYCGSEHQKLDRPLHKNLCNAAKKIMQRCNVSHPFHLNGRIHNKKDLEETIVDVKFLLRYVLSRQLQFYEEELSSFPAYCSTCYSFKKWRACNGCQAVAYCSEEHAREDAPNHSAMCAILKLYYCPYKVLQRKNVDILRFNRTTCKLVGSDLKTWYETASSMPLPKVPTESPENYQRFAFAADFSCIGTLCYALNLMKMQSFDISEFVIFIVGATVEQQLWFQEIHTKLFFACFPQVLALTLYFIGPEAVADSLQHSLGYVFEGQTRKVVYVTYVGKFEDFVKECNVKPYLIVAYNCGFSEHSVVTTDKVQIANKPSESEETAQTATPQEDGSTRENLRPEQELQWLPKTDFWAEGVKKILLNFNILILFTSFTLMEAEFDLAYVKNIVETHEIGIEATEVCSITLNPFRDLRPLRSWQFSGKEDIFYRNGYMQGVMTKSKHLTLK